jgi:hypothetical protein
VILDLAYIIGVGMAIIIIACIIIAYGKDY